MSIERNDPANGPDQARDLAPNTDIAPNDGVLDYVADIALELAILLEGQSLTGLGHDLRCVAEQVHKAKYQMPEA